VVLAGGPGERFWPASTARKPKPFLRLWGQRSLLQEAVARATSIAGPGRVWVSSSAAYLSLLADELPAELVRDRLILEPCRRDTAAGIGLAALRLHLADPGATLVALPADHFVGDLGAFTDAIQAAIRTAARGYLVVLGVAPTRPETGYGYIQTGPALESLGRQQVVQVQSFVEKPDQATSLAFLRDGRHLWNTGVLVATARTVLEAIRRHMPAIGAGLEAIRARAQGGEETAWAETVEKVFPGLPATSFDYGVLQHAHNLAAVRGEFPWDDVGNWDSLTRVSADAAGNHVHGASVALDVRRSVLRNESSDRMLIGFGLEDVAVIVTDRVIVVAPRERSAEWKEMLRVLTEKGYGTLIGVEDGPGVEPAPLGPGLAAAAASGMATVVEKPWGREIWWAQTERYAAKLIEVHAGQELSLQYHEEKMETQLFLYGSGQVVLAGREWAIRPGLRLTIRPGQVHRVTADSDVLFLEASSPELDDVVRLDDRYGRAADA
jgi:mannose-1-phosphate guanylyltransferase